MVTTKTYLTSTQSFPLVFNSLTALSFYTSGGIKYTGSNIECTGQTLRLFNGELNKNMIQQHHLLIEIRSYDLMLVNDAVIDPMSQVKLGSPTKEFSQSGTKTFIWKFSPDKCPLMVVMNTNLESTTGHTWFSDQHKIQITALDAYHDTRCDIKVIKTSSDNIFLADNTQPTSHLEHINSINIDLSVDLQIRFNFLYSEISQILHDGYKDRNPICNNIKSTNLIDTQRIGSSKFIRNLGDISVTFKCQEVRVAPADSEKCHSMVPVTDIKGNTWFLNPINRILMKKAITVPCTAATLPIYRNQNDQFLTFNPKRTLIKEEMGKQYNASLPNPNTGLYPADLVKDWLNYAFLQHWSKFSYTSLANTFCQSDHCKEIQVNTDMMSQYVSNAMKTLSNPSLPGLFLGIDIKDLGGRCSIAVVAVLILYTCYAIITWIIRLFLFKNDSIKTWAWLCRTTFPSFFLIAKNVNNDV